MSRVRNVSHALATFLDAAAEAYGAAGHPLAQAAAESLRACLPPKVPPIQGRPPALEDLGAALETLVPGRLADSLNACAARIPWSDAAFDMPGPLAGRYAFVEIAGPAGFASSDDLRFGLYLQMRETDYPAHSHAAEELYLILSGTAKWRKADGAFAPRAPGTLIHHRPDESHAMETAAEPLLAMWLWIGDLDRSSYRFDGA